MNMCCLLDRVPIILKDRPFGKYREFSSYVRYLVFVFPYDFVWIVNISIVFIFSSLLLLLQFYTFFETTLVTLALLPHFIAFFSEDESFCTPGSLATTFLGFGKQIY